MSEQKNENCGGMNMAPGQICWFEVPSDNPERARQFYGELFGWKSELFPGSSDMWSLQTSGDLAGGLMQRKHPMHQGITNYVMVKSVDQSSDQVAKLGGKICVPKTAVPFMGYFAVCQDTEGNMFGIWEADRAAK